MNALVPTVFVIDDDDAVRNSLRMLFGSIGLPVQVFASAQDFLLQYALEHPGCLVVDVRMPGMSGLALQHELNLRGATVPLIFITGHGDIAMAVEAMQHGAFNFLAKPFRDQDLIERVRHAMQQDAAHRLEFGNSARIRERLESLTPREREVLALVTSGKANKVMAAELGVSQRTIEIHRARVMAKMQAGSLAALVRMSLEVAGNGSVP